jgi:SAM-dependent methyltransferase
MDPTDPYRDPVVYDLEYSDRGDDIDHYLAVARRVAPRGPLLELGCGNGRIALQLARAGMQVVGLDASRPMLHDFRRKLAYEPEAVRARANTVEGDFCDLENHAFGPFPLVTLPFNALHHCSGHSALERLFRGVHAKTQPHGVFALDCYLPDPALYARDAAGRYEARTFSDPRTGHEIFSWEEAYWDPEQRIHHVTYVYEHAHGRVDRIELKLHMYQRAELAELIHRCGWTILQQWGDFQGSPMTAASTKWVMELVRR